MKKKPIILILNLAFLLFCNSLLINAQSITTTPSDVWQNSGVLYISNDAQINNAWLSSGNSLPVYSNGNFNIAFNNLPPGLDTVNIVTGGGSNTITAPFFIDLSNEPHILIETTASPWCLPGGGAFVVIEGGLTLDSAVIGNTIYLPNLTSDTVFINNIISAEHTVRVCKGTWVKQLLIQIDEIPPVNITNIIIDTIPTCDDASDGIILVETNGNATISRWREGISEEQQICNNCINTQFTDIAVGFDSILVVDDYGCETYEIHEIPLTYNDCLIIYSFSPNEDGYNDFFQITAPQSAVLEVTVYGKTGKILYHSNDYQNDWTGISEDGEILNGDYPAQVIMNFNNSKLIKREFITINRGGNE